MTDAPTKQNPARQDLSDIDRKIEEAEGLKRDLKGPLATLVRILAIGMSLYHIYTAGFGLITVQIHRAVHLLFTFALLFLLVPATKRSDSRRVPWYDIVLALLGVAVTGYIIVNYEQLVLRASYPTTMDTVMGVLAIVLVLEATRRALGPALAIVSGLFLIYAYFGPYFPGLFAHRGYSLARIAEHMYLTTEGIFGIPLGVSATFVILFIIFGAFLEVTGAGHFFIRMALALFGHTRGGPAKAAVLASGTVGMINGSSVANVVTTGTFTIPLMKRVGFKPHVAGGVEVAASSTGQYMPPIMGAAAFVMAEMTGIPYVSIAIAAAIPALLDYTAILTMVHLEALKSGIQGLPKSELPDFWQTLREGGHLLIPVIGIVAMLLGGFTPMRAAFFGILLIIAASWLRPWTRIGIREILLALEKGARNAVGVAMACAAAGLIVGTVTLTGLGLRLTSLVVALAGDNFYLAMGLTIIGSLVLGLAMPTTAKYIIVATIAAPILVQFGAPLIAAHLFVLYYAVLADDTPPVGVAAYAAAGVARSDPWLTGLQGFKFDISGLLIPVMFVTSPALLLIDVTPFELVRVLITALVGIVCLSAFLQNYFIVPCRWYERLGLLTVALTLVSADVTTDFIGLIVLALIIALQWPRRARPAAPAVGA